MTLDSVVFIENLPKIDLHGMDREVARVAINDFINENYKLKNSIFCIIHGIGSGVLRKTTSDVLKSNKKVLEYKTYYYNQGSTIVRISID